MKKALILVAAIAAFALMAVGCSDNPNPVQPSTLPTAGLATAAKITLPPDATLESATFYIYVSQATAQTVNVHRITDAWEETVVTWNNFGGAFAPGVEDFFVVDAVDWRSADVTGLVAGWLNGDYENYGLLLDQVAVAYPRTLYHSRENATNHPYLEVCYTTAAGELVCETVEPSADAYIYESMPDANTGLSTSLRTGYSEPNDLEKQSLLWFELEQIPHEEEDGCTLTIGYWKTHAGFGPQADMVTAHLPIWLGDDDGLHSIPVTDAATAVAVLEMKTYGKNNNGITKLYAQLLAAKLNVANGADDMDVADFFADADAFLAEHDWTDWSGLSDDDKDMVLGWQGYFDDYNNGLVGPGHCDDIEPLDDMVD